MATYSQDQALAAHIKAASKKLKNATFWSTKTVFEFKDSFLLELYLLFLIAADLQENYDVKYDEGAPPNRHVFPQNGANKATRPKFFVCDKSTGNVLFQICAGTKAKDIHGHYRALDVSIQRASASDDPTHDDVLQIFDAKHRDSLSKRISHHEFSEFARWLELFELRETAPPSLEFSEEAFFDANCLVTNGDFSTEPVNELHRTSVREISQFHPNGTTTHRPEKSESKVKP